jgi:hypothetical protein
MTNEEFFKSLKTNNIRYMLCDLHVHSIASADILDDGRYEQLGNDEKKLIDSLGINRDNFKGKWWGYDSLVASKIKPEDYLDLIGKRRDQIADSYDLLEGKDGAVIAITDYTPTHCQDRKRGNLRWTYRL